MFPDLVPRVMETLKKYFGKPEFILNDIIKDIRETPGPKVEYGESIINYSMKIDDLCLAMKFSELDPIMWNNTILYEVIHKLPPSLQYEWGAHSIKMTAIEKNLQVFSEWLQEKSTVFASIISTAPIGTKNKSQTGRTRINVHMDQKERRECLICSESCPRVTDCTVFNEMSYKDKMIVVNRKHLCFLCLKRHKGKCISDIKCEVEGCTYSHNSILHKPPLDTENHVNHHRNMIEIAPLFKVIPVILYGRGVSITTIAFLDDFLDRNRRISIQKTQT